MIRIGEPLIRVQKFSILPMPVHGVKEVRWEADMAHAHVLLCDVGGMVGPGSSCPTCGMVGSRLPTAQDTVHGSGQALMG